MLFVISFFSTYQKKKKLKAGNASAFVLKEARLLGLSEHLGDLNLDCHDLALRFSLYYVLGFKDVAKRALSDHLQNFLKDMYAKKNVRCKDVRKIGKNNTNKQENKEKHKLINRITRN